MSATSHSYAQKSLKATAERLVCSARNEEGRLETQGIPSVTL